MRRLYGPWGSEMLPLALKGLEEKRGGNKKNRDKSSTSESRQGGVDQRT